MTRRDGDAERKRKVENVKGSVEEIKSLSVIAFLYSTTQTFCVKTFDRHCI